MKCPICDATLRPGTDRCPSCGYRCAQTYTAPNQSPAQPQQPHTGTYTPPNKGKKRTGCCCALAVLIPVVIFVIAAVFSFFEYVMEDFAIAEPAPGWYEDEPYAQEPGDLIPESIPAPADDSCFVMVENTLMFLPDRWDGSPILSVPETVNGERVTNIGPGCFQNCTELTTILLPESVTTISPMAFAGCSKLRGLYLHDGVESIGQDAFAGCKSMEAIYIPASVTHIAEHTFDDCASLLYIFYGGVFEDWDALYSDYVNPYTTAVCLDGHYYHGAAD